MLNLQIVKGEYQKLTIYLGEVYYIGLSIKENAMGSLYEYMYYVFEKSVLVTMIKYQIIIMMVSIISFIFIFIADIHISNKCNNNNDKYQIIIIMAPLFSFFFILHC